MKQSALFFLLVTHFSIAVTAQYEWRMNSAGRYVYVNTVTVNTGASTSNKSSSGSSTTTSSKNKYETIIVFHESFAAVAKNSKYGFIDEYDKLVIPFTYDYADNFFEGRALVRLHGKYGYINTSGKEVIPLIYDKAERFESYTATVEKDNERYKIYPDGKTASTPTVIDPNKKRKPTYSYKRDYYNGIAIIVSNSKFGSVNWKDETILPAIYDEIRDFRRGEPHTTITEAKLNGKWGLINRDGKVILPFIYDGLVKEELVKGDFFRASMNNKWGAIDNLGKIIIPFRYENMEFFFDGLGPVQLNKKWGYIDEKGKIIIPIKFDYISNYPGRFQDLLFVVGIKNKFGVINKANKIIVPLIYDEVSLSRYGYIKATLKSKDLYFDPQGKSCEGFKY